MAPTPMCLCLLTRTSRSGRVEVLLGRKKTGFGTGKIVALGGHIEADETPAHAAAREVQEECGILVAAADLERLGKVTFRFPARPSWDLTVTVFGANRWVGEASESAEIAPTWFRLDQLPWDAMWDDARFWLPHILAGRHLDAVITYAADCETVAAAHLTPASTAMPGGKLVRDLIPHLIRGTGEVPITRTAAPEEYRALLRAKLVEEVDEVLASDDPSELADVLEVLLALASDLGIDPDELEKLRAAKALERGGFSARVVWSGNTAAP